MNESRLIFLKSGYSVFSIIDGGGLIFSSRCKTAAQNRRVDCHQEQRVKSSQLDH